jgi:hypothetical protein
MTDEVRASLARVVAGADEERRRIERELHDGVQQNLVALVVNAQLAREVGEHDLPAALGLLDDVARDARAALEAVRELAARVYPPLLVDRGLAEALRAAAAASGARAEVDGLVRQAPAIEAAAYFCCLDALAGGGGEAGHVRVWQEDGALRLEVAPGALDATSTARERVVALDGRLDVGGGRVAATIPLPR